MPHHCPICKQSFTSLLDLDMHMPRCRKKHQAYELIECPYNAMHVVLAPELAHHLSRCPDKNLDNVNKKRSFQQAFS